MIEVVEKIVFGETNKVFCVVRLFGYYSGLFGLVGMLSEFIGIGLYGFCLINNVVVVVVYV